MKGQLKGLSAREQPTQAVSIKISHRNPSEEPINLSNPFPININHQSLAFKPKMPILSKSEIEELSKQIKQGLKRKTLKGKQLETREKGDSNSLSPIIPHKRTLSRPTQNLNACRVNSESEKDAMLDEQRTKLLSESNVRARNGQTDPNFIENKSSNRALDKATAALTQKAVQNFGKNQAYQESFEFTNVREFISGPQEWRKHDLSGRRPLSYENHKRNKNGSASTILDFKGNSSDIPYSTIEIQKKTDVTSSPKKGQQELNLFKISTHKNASTPSKVGSTIDISKSPINTQASPIKLATESLYIEGLCSKDQSFMLEEEEEDEQFAQIQAEKELKLEISKRDPLKEGIIKNLSANIDKEGQIDKVSKYTQNIHNSAIELSDAGGFEKSDRNRHKRETVRPFAAQEKRVYTSKTPPINKSKIPVNFQKASTQTHEERQKIASLQRQLIDSKNIDKSPSKLTKIRSSSEKQTSDIKACDNHQSALFEEGEEFPEGDPPDVEEEEELDDYLEESTTASSQSGMKKPMLLPSVYEGRPHTIFFQYHPCCEKTRESTRAVYLSAEEEKSYDLKYKCPKHACLIRTFETAGMKKIEGSSWNAHWGNPNHNRIKGMNKYQKTNHFPGCWQLGRKDYLWKNLSRLKRTFTMDYNFVPNTYLLASDYNRFAAAKECADNKSLWIMKPCASACGRGIKLVSKKTKVVRNINYLVSEYISNPHLINGLKYDLRLYVLVSSYDPLRIYLHKEGLVRFATQKYSTKMNSLKERFVHLTNWSVNKMSENFVKNSGTSRDDEGSKWSFAALRKKYIELGIDVDELWKKIEDIIIKTIISAEPYMLSSMNRTPKHRNNCYELYGFDVLIDSNCKPWLMEVNVCPSLNSSSPLDKKVKTTVICDSMNLLGYQPYDKKKFEEKKKNKTPGKESRKHQSRNINDASNLNAENCLNILSSDDWNVVFETDEEWYRKGNFERIFPNRENCEIYSKYFEFQRYNNTIVWKWLNSAENFLEKICAKVSNISV